MATANGPGGRTGGRGGPGPQRGTAYGYLRPLVDATVGAERGRPAGLVLVPTAELVNQVREVLTPLAGARNLKVAALAGNGPADGRAMRRRADIVIGTPQSVVGLSERDQVSVAEVRLLVLDEADTMADLGQLPQVEWVLQRLGPDHRAMLADPTARRAVGHLARAYSIATVGRPEPELAPAPAAAAALAPEPPAGPRLPAGPLAPAAALAPAGPLAPEPPAGALAPPPPPVTGGGPPRSGSVTALVRRARASRAAARAWRPSGGPSPDTVDPLVLFRALEASPRFRRDTLLGGIFHHGKISFREVSTHDSLHVIIHGDRIVSHLDKVSPLDCRPDVTSHYSWRGVLAHNLTGMAEDLVRLGRGRPKPSRCEAATEIARVDSAFVRDLLAETAREEAAASAGPGLPRPVPVETASVPFGVIDEAVHLLDTEASPWSIQLEARPGGHLDEDRLRWAMAEGLACHAMARARKQPSRRLSHRDTWEVPEVADLDPLRSVDCPDDEALRRLRESFQSVAVPLAESPPLRAVLACHPGGDVVMVNVNHAAMDGHGALRVLRSVARAYAGEPDLVPSLDFVEARDLPVRLAAPTASARARRHLALLEKLRDLALPPARLAASGGDDRTGYGFHQVSVPALELDGDKARGDALLAALHLAIAGWNARQGAGCGRIGVLMTADLRPEQWRDDMVGNFSLPARVSTTRRDRRSPAAALACLAAQTRRKQRSGMGTALIEVLRRSQRFPLWAKQLMVQVLALTGDRLIDTALLSDLGELHEPVSFGPASGGPRETWYSPPAPLPRGLAVGAVTTGGRLHLSFRYRHRLFDDEAAGRFADLFVGHLAAVGGGARR